MLSYAPDKPVVDKINYHIDFYDISIKRHKNHHDRFIVKNYRTYAYLTDVGDYENNLCLDRIIFVNHKFNIFTLNDPYRLIYLAHNSDFCPYIKNTPKIIYSLINQPNNTCQNIIWRDKTNHIGIADNHQSLIIPMDDIKEFWVKTDFYELARYQDISYFCLMLTTKENKNYQIFQQSQKEVVDDICGILNHLMV